MSIIDDSTYWDGNTTITEIRLRLGLAYGWASEPTMEQVRTMLQALVSEDLITKDGTTAKGGHYALTFKGKRKLARLREQLHKAA